MCHREKKDMQSFQQKPPFPPRTLFFGFCSKEREKKRYVQNDEPGRSIYAAASKPGIELQR